MRIEHFELPDFWLPALFNDDTSGMTDEDVEIMEDWFDYMHGEFETMIPVSQEPIGHRSFHAAGYRVGACEVTLIGFDVDGR